MTDTVLLDNINHGDIKIITSHSDDFNDNVNQVLVFPTEFGDVHREYPIFFSKTDEGAFQSVALLGLDKDENLFLSSQRGRQTWRARYIPAIQQRGPFMIGFQEKMVDGESRQEPMIHIDLDHPRVSKTEGEAVFQTHGGNTPYLDHIGAVLRTLHQGVEISTAMFAAFEELDLIEQVAVEIKLSDTEQYNLSHYYTISEERLTQLDGASLERLNTLGFLRVAFLIVASLGNVSHLVNLKNQVRRV